MPDAIFSHPRLAQIYDALDGDRTDLDHYEAMVSEFGATAIVDIGCGTGTFACRLALRNFRVVGVDPAAASLEVARHRLGGDRVTWVHGDAARHALPPGSVDLVTMTGNVAQVFVDDGEWSATLQTIRDVLRPGGRFVFEARDPAFQGWTEWTRDATFAVTDTALGPVESWVALTAVELPLVSFRWSFRFLEDGTELASDSTLRFRSHDELHASLRSTGFMVEEVRDAPDRPGREFVFVTMRAD